MLINLKDAPINLFPKQCSSHLLLFTIYSLGYLPLSAKASRNKDLSLYNFFRNLFVHPHYVHY